MGFMGTKRNMYSPEKVRNMRSERKTKKAKVDGCDDTTYQHCLGDLIGAGHLKITGFTKMETDITNDTNPLANFFGNNITQTGVVIKHKIEFESYKHGDRDGVRHHLEGYLSSGHPNDPTFRLKGWFNEDGSIRIELVK